MEVGFNRLRSVFFALCKGLNTPRSLAAWLLFKHGEHAQLVQLETRPENYTDSDYFSRDYLVTEYLSKSDFLHLNVDRKAVALQTFAESEVCCRETNRRLKRNAESPSPDHTRVNAIMSMASRKIASLLGNVESIDWDRCMWGPGNTFSLRGEVCLGDKLLEEQISITPQALQHFLPVFGQDIHWARARGIEADGPFTPLATEFEIVRGCRLTTVPKNAKTDRTIAIEPTANIFLQKAVGAHIRHRLRRVGIDLNDQSRNQSLARLGSRTGHLATLDLRRASDSVSRQLIWDLLPYDWAVLLDDLRSHCYFSDGRWSYFEKFSSMGNGFTFELESLIFWALARSCAEFLGDERATVSVYGDDVIVPTECVPPLVEVLGFVGFELNPKKSFSTTLFRESCGGHYFGGFDVTPIYQKELPTRREEIYKLANRIRRRALRDYGLDVGLGTFNSAWHAAILGYQVKHVLPLSSESDDGLLLSRDELLSGAYGPIPTSVGPGLGWLFPTWTYRTKKRTSFSGLREGVRDWGRYYFALRFKSGRRRESFADSLIDFPAYRSDYWGFTTPMSGRRAPEVDAALVIDAKIDPWSLRKVGRYVSTKRYLFSVSE